MSALNRPDNFPGRAALGAIARRYPHTVRREGGGLRDVESGAFYQPPSIRHALGWIAAGEDHEERRASRLANWWHRRHSVEKDRKEIAQ